MGKAPGTGCGAGMDGILLREARPEGGPLDRSRIRLDNAGQPLCGRQVMAKIREFLTVGEASEYLGVSPTSLRRWDRAGTLKARRNPANKYRLYLKADLDKFLGELGVVEEPIAPSSRAKKKRKRTR